VTTRTTTSQRVKVLQLISPPEEPYLWHFRPSRKYDAGYVDAYKLGGKTAAKYIDRTWVQFSPTREPPGQRTYESSFLLPFPSGPLASFVPSATFSLDVTDLVLPFGWSFGGLEPLPFVLDEATSQFVTPLFLADNAVIASMRRVPAPIRRPQSTVRTKVSSIRRKATTLVRYVA
jgi:hypothetical protein